MPARCGVRRVEFAVETLGRSIYNYCSAFRVHICSIDRASRHMHVSIIDALCVGMS